jgi:WD40-like Beta Propeller Repeat
MDTLPSPERKLTMARLATMRVAGTVGLAVLMVASVATVVQAAYRSPWAVAVNAESVPDTSPELNTPSLDGCPSASPDGRSLYLASNRPGGLGGPDIWSSTRRNLQARWSPPVNLAPNVTSAAAETRASFADHGRTLYFGSARPGSEGSSDLYVTTRQRKHDVDAAATPVCRRGWPAFGAGSGCDAAATDRWRMLSLT